MLHERGAAAEREAHVPSRRCPERVVPGDALAEGLAGSREASQGAGRQMRGKRLDGGGQSLNERGERGGGRCRAAGHMCENE